MRHLLLPEGQHARLHHRGRRVPRPARGVRARGCAVFGVSRDSLKSHDGFKAKLGLPFELVADTGESACRLFGVIKTKTLYGKQVQGVERSTFLIDKDGVLRREWRALKADGHAAEVLRAVAEL
jgi:peroxiredoxin Q/BCP